jgi:hypothetical protein
VLKYLGVVNADAFRIALIFLGDAPSWVSGTADLNNLVLLDFVVHLGFA